MWINKEFIFAFWMCFQSLTIVEGKHYRGGTIYWSPVDDKAEQVKITYRLGFKLNHVEIGHDDCTPVRKESGELLQTNGYLQCDECNNGRNQKIENLRYICTDFDTAGQWSSGINSIIYDAPSTNFNVSYENCCWIDLVSHGRGSGRGWKLTSAIDLSRRPDTGRINSSPISEALPVIFMKKGCRYAIQIPVLDPDNDVVRCRWPDTTYECNKVNNGVCGPTPKSRLNKKSCRLRFDAKKMKVGWHAVNLIIEDFVNETSTTPLSKVSLQFLIRVLNSAKCNKPTVISPTFGTCVTIETESYFHFPYIVSVAAGRQVQSLTALKPKGMSSSAILSFRGENSTFYSNLTWVPTIEQIGKHTACFQATDNSEYEHNRCEYKSGPSHPRQLVEKGQSCTLMSPTDMTCMHLNVVEAGSIEPLIGQPDPEMTSDGGELNKRTKLQFEFNREIQRPKKANFITFLNSSGIEVDKIDASSKLANIKFKGRVLEFSVPQHFLRNSHAGYRIVFDAGVANSATNCGVSSEPFEWNMPALVLRDPILRAVRKPPAAMSVPLIPRTAVPECLSSYMTIYVSKKYVGEIDPSRMHLIDPSCRGELHNDTHYVIGTGYKMCGTIFQMKKNDIPTTGAKNVMENIIYVPASPYTNGSIITREHNIEIHINCSITSEHIMHVEFDPEVKTIVYYESGFGSFNFSLKMYKTENFNTYLQYTDFPISVYPKQRLYFEASSWARSGTELLLDTCRATPTANPYDAIQYTFIEDGCAVDDTVIMHPVKLPLQKRFSVSVFAFLGHYMDDSVFVHCDMRISDLTNQKSEIARGCTAITRRSKRDVSKRKSSAAYLDTDGPIKIVVTPHDREFKDDWNAFNDYVIQTAMIGVVILLVIILMVLQLLGVTCRRQAKYSK